MAYTPGRTTTVTNTDAPKSDFNVTGYPNDEFITETANSQLRAKNEVMFALLVNGIPGEPDFGVGLPKHIGDSNVLRLTNDIRDKVKKVKDLVSAAVEYKGVAVGRIPGKQYVAVDAYFIDKESGADIFIPLGIRG